MNPASASKTRPAPFLLTAVAAVIAGCATPPASTPAAPTAPTAPIASAAPGAPAAGTPARPPSPPGAAGPAGAAAAAPATGAAAPGGPGAAAAARPPAPAPGTPPPFADVTKDAKSTPGFLPVWTKDERTWLEIPADRLDKPFFLGVSLASGLGERFLLPGLMVGDRVVTLRRVGNTVQLIARNLHARAPEGTPLARAVGESYSDSLLAAAPLAAAAHPERKSLLVDASALLGGDVVGAQTFLEQLFRLPYSIDRANSSVERTRSGEQGTAIVMRTHYAVPKLPAPPQVHPGGPPPNPATLPNPPRTVPDARSFFLSQSYTLAPLPAAPMKPRLADQRVGYFTDGFVDFGDHLASPDRKVHLITRWRLEKKDPAAALSEPREPIRVVLDRNIPERWRATVRAGVLEWNKAFERAGFRDALVVEQQPADADWQATEGTRMLAVRWFAMEGPGALAVGPSQSDPRTGEILRGAAIIPDNWVRFDRAGFVDTIASQGAAGTAAAELQHDAFGEFARRYAQCSYASDALEQAATGLELLALRGDLQPGSAEEQRYIEDGLKAVVVHEVGHALGLRHNFKASSGVTAAQLRDANFTAERGVSNSVMDYNPPNVPLQGEAVASYHMTGLGAYDHWAIEYGYREFAPADEKAALAALAGRGDADPTLAYGPDEDLALADPSINQFDLGDDPMAYAQRQLRVARELWARTQTRTLAPDDDLTIYRRNLQRGLNRVAQSVPLLTKYVGGTYSARTLAGSGKALLAPAPPGQQRAALDVLLSEVFASSSFRFEPRFLSRLGVDQFDRGPGGNNRSSTDFSVAGAVAGIQRSALDALMSDATAARLADAELKVADPKALPSYADVQARLAGAVWSELNGKAGEIDSLRRNLQREHLRRLAAGLLRPTSTVPTDVRAVYRQVALRLDADLRAALAGPAARGWPSIARAHLADSQAVLAEALKAPLSKQGV
jgi:hypothetical protein